MYVEQYIAKEKQRERLKQAEEVQLRRQVAQFRRLKRRQERAERQLIDAWRRVEELWETTNFG